MTNKALSNATIESLTDNNRLANTLIFDHLLSLLCVTLTIALLTYLLHYANYGYDFTDEGFYLTWISTPYVYESSVTQFGYIYHPLYVLTHGNIGLLRQFNIIFTFILASLFIFTCLIRTTTQHLSRLSLVTFSASIATTSTMLFRSWLATPNYNSLTLQGILLAATGLLLTESKKESIQLIGILMTGTGGWLTFMAKPSSAILLAITTTIFILVSQTHTLKKLILIGSSALLFIIMSALLIDGSLIAFIHRLTNGMHYANRLGSGHTLLHAFRIDHFQLTKHTRHYFLLLTLYMTLTAIGISFKNKLINYICFISILCLPVLIATCLSKVEEATFAHFLILTAPVSWLIMSLITLDIYDVIKRIRTDYHALTLMLLLPYLYAFGTNINYWMTSFAAAIFWITIPLSFFSLNPQRLSIRLLAFFGISCQLLTFAIIHASLETPYRQDQALHKNSVVTKIGAQQSPLILSEGYSRYVSDAQQVSSKANFKPQTGIIDLTGQSPGILYAIGAKNIGQPWLIGSYPGSEQVVEESLKKVSCKVLATSWVLIEPDGPRKISPNVLDSFGANLQRDYMEAGSWQTALGAGGYQIIRDQILLKPTRSPEELIMICEKTRKGIK